MGRSSKFRRVHPYGMADDSGDTEQDFLRWKEDLWKHWHKVLPDLHSVSNQEPAEGELVKSAGTLHAEPEEQGRFLLAPAGVVVVQPDQDLPKDFNFSKYVAAKKAKVVEIKELRQMPTEDLSTLQIELQLPPGETYQTAENMVVFPVNTPKAVEKMLAYLQKTGSERVSLNPKMSPEEHKKAALSFPPNKSLRSILKKFIDIKAPVK